MLLFSLHPARGPTELNYMIHFFYLLVIKGISQVHLFCISTIILTGTKQTDTKTMGKICEMHFDRMQDMITLNNCGNMPQRYCVESSNFVTLERWRPKFTLYFQEMKNYRTGMSNSLYHGPHTAHYESKWAGPTWQICKVLVNYCPDCPIIIK